MTPDPASPTLHIHSKTPSIKVDFKIEACNYNKVGYMI